MVLSGWKTAKFVDGCLLLPEEWADQLEGNDVYLLKYEVYKHLVICLPDVWEMARDLVSGPPKKIKELDESLEYMGNHCREVSKIIVEYGRVAIGNGLLEYVRYDGKGELSCYGVGDSIMVWCGDIWSGLPEVEFSDECQALIDEVEF